MEEDRYIAIARVSEDYRRIIINCPFEEVSYSLESSCNALELFPHLSLLYYQSPLKLTSNYFIANAISSNATTIKISSLIPLSMLSLFYSKCILSLPIKVSADFAF